MAVTVFILREYGDPVLKFGPCRYLNDSEEQSVVDHLCNRIRELAPCKVTLRACTYEGKSVIPGDNEMTYNPKKDSPEKVTEFVKKLVPHFWSGLLNLYVKPNKGRKVDFEFEDIDF